MKRNNSMLGNHRLWMFFIGSALLAIQTGCVSVDMNTSNFPGEDLTPTAAEAMPGYKVIFGTSKGKQPKIFRGQIGENVTVEEALREAGATKRFKRGMRVDLARRMENGRVLKLPVNYDIDLGRVIDEQNYALHPGDEILVRREDNGMLNDVFKNMKSPF